MIWKVSVKVNFEVKLLLGHAVVCAFGVLTSLIVFWKNITELMFWSP